MKVLTLVGSTLFGAATLIAMLQQSSPASNDIRFIEGGAGCKPNCIESAPVNSTVEGNPLGVTFINGRTGCGRPVCADADEVKPLAVNFIQGQAGCRPNCADEATLNVTFIQGRAGCKPGCLGDEVSLELAISEGEKGNG